MYCESCGSFISDGEVFCSNCGSPAPKTAASATPAATPAPQAIVQPIPQPVYQQPLYQAPTYQQPVQMVQPVYQPVYQQPVIITPIDNRKRVNGAATAGLILGIVNVCISWLPLFNTLPAILGLVFSIVGLSKKDAGGKGRAIAGLIMSSVGLLIVVLIIIEAAVGNGLSNY